MEKYVELLADVFLSRKDRWHVEFVAVRAGDYIKPGAHLGLIENQRGGGASLTSRFGGEIVSVSIKEGDPFSADEPIALVRVNYFEFPNGWMFANFYAGAIFGANRRRVFLVQGHGHTTNKVVEAFLLEQQMQPVILSDEPGKGRTIIEKFEESADVGFAIVLFTPDDLGTEKTGAESGRFLPRARQNVVLELGYFIARLGRSRVCALRHGNIELPSDILGISYIEFDESGHWRSEVKRELAAAGYPVDLRPEGDRGDDHPEMQ